MTGYWQNKTNPYLTRDLPRSVHLHNHPVLGELLLDEHHLLLALGDKVSAGVVGTLINLGQAEVIQTVQNAMVGSETREIELQTLKLYFFFSI